MKVLHVDDSPEICDLYSDLFTVDNHTVDSTNNGQEGIKLVLKNDYDLILLDMCMPKYSGMDFLKELKEKRSSELRKVVVTSVLKFSETQIQELKKYEIHAVEEKPKDIQQLETLQKNMWLR